MRRAVIAGAVAASVVLVPRAAIAPAPPQIGTVVVMLDGASLPALLEVPELRALASRGGAALLSGRADVRTTFELAAIPVIDASTPGDAAEALSQALAAEEDPSLAMVISTSPTRSSQVRGDELGAIVMAEGYAQHLLEQRGVPNALTSDSTRRAGAVATVDPVATIVDRWGFSPTTTGAPIRYTDEPAPLELYERYLQQRRLAVPVAAASWVAIGVAAIGVMLLLRARERAGDLWLRVAGLAAASFPWLVLSLLLVGHLTSLTPWTVAAGIAFVVGVGTAATAWATVRWGALRALAGTGTAILGVLLIEALTGWWAAVTPLIGGGQLDGGRFFGMPNAMIGLVLGAALYAAHRLDPRRGAALLAACALVAGSPWTGANFGAAITLFAASGLWLGVRTRRPWWLVAVLAAVTTATGMAAIAVLHRYLTERPTHVTSFLASGGGVWGAVERFVDRLGIGLDLLVDSPLAIVPVLGTLVLLAIVLRPPASLAAAFAASEDWRRATLVLLLGSVVAYVANDTGAAALGLGFVLALAATLHVSVAATRGMMGR